jgi:hypothetical protein
MPGLWSAGDADYFTAALIELNLLLRSALPVLLTAVMIASAMPTAIRQYSMAVAPFSSARNDLITVIVNSCYPSNAGWRRFRSGKVIH